MPRPVLDRQEPRMKRGEDGFADRHAVELWSKIRQVKC